MKNFVLPFVLLALRALSFGAEPELIELEPTPLQLAQQEYAALRQADSPPAALSRSCFNIAVCLVAEAEAPDPERNNYERWAQLDTATQLLLEAARLDPTLKPARGAIEICLTKSEAIRKTIKNEEEEQQEQEEQQAELAAMLQELVDRQSALLEDAHQFTKRRPLVITALQKIHAAMPESQTNLKADTLDFFTQIPDIKIDDQELLTNLKQLITESVEAQSNAIHQITDSPIWRSVQTAQSTSLERLNEARALFSKEDEAGDDEEFSEDEWDEDLEYDYSDADEATMSSLALEGNFSSFSEQKSLPTPNFSMEEIMMEESDNQQFRQEQRSQSQDGGGKIKKNW